MHAAVRAVKSPHWEGPWSGFILTVVLAEVLDVYYPPEVRRGKYCRLGVFLL